MLMKFPRLACSWLAYLACTFLCFAEEAITDRVLVKYEPTVAEEERVKIAQRHQLTLMREIPLFRIFVYSFDSESRTVEEVCTALRQEPGVVHAEPDHVRTLASVNDPSFGQQWYLRNTGQTVNGKTGPTGVDIRWLDARTRYQPQGKLKVAVVDSGVTLLHPEIVGSMFLKTAEIINGLDDDGNNLVDDFSGYDFYSFDASALDQNGHGTLVAGIIAGAINNSAGGAGITNAVEIIPYRVFDQFGRGGQPKFRVGGTSVSDVLLSVAVAVSEGAKIINLSLGGSGYNQLEKEAYDDLVNHGVLAVIAAGNGGLDGIGDNNDSLPTYPASYSSSAIISVAAQQRNGGLATFSNYGVASVDIAAPGTDIYGPDVNRRVVFTQNFNGSTSGWTVGRSSYDYSGVNWNIDYLNGDGFLTDRLTNSTYAPWTDTWVSSPYISLAGRTGARLEFDMLLLIADDMLVLEVSGDGINWTDYAYYYGAEDQGYSQRRIDISDLDGLAGYFRFRLLTNGSWQDWGVAIDNIVMSGIDDFNQSNPRYTFNSGTSFAAPIVAGVAAMVWTHRPDLTAQQVRNVILQSRRSFSALSGKVSTGGAVDANAALILAEAQPKQAQSVTFSAISDRTFNPSGSNTVSLSASASSGLSPVTYTVTAGPATVSGGTLTITGPGTISVTATQAGNLSYNSASSTRTFTVAKAIQNLSFTVPATQAFTFSPLTLTGTATSGLSPSFTIVSGPASIVNGNQLALSGTGTVVIRASQSGDAVYAAAAPVERTIVVTANFDSWRQGNFSSQELSNAAISGPNAVRSADGLTNLLKYALGLSANGTAAQPPLAVAVNGTQWSATYARPSARSDLSYEVEYSTNLTDWTSLGVTHQKIATNADTETWRATVTAGGNVFFRLKINRP